MNINHSSPIEILSDAESARRERFRRASLLLETNSVLKNLLVESEKLISQEWPNSTLLKNTSGIVKSHHVQRSVTDWPFEHFWDNPREPLHSKLLGYFINPAEDHGWGRFLLGKFFAVIAPDRVFELDRCEVHVEVEGVDISIERWCDDAKYSVIIENKINWAVDQDRQLQRYVDKAHERGFAYNEIHVFYLPLNADKDPNQLDLQAIRKYGVSYKKITFEDQIERWLNTILDQKMRAEWPVDVHQGMQDNLAHYRNLIRYLNRRKKEREMNVDILKQLEEVAKTGPLPSWKDVEQLKKSATALQDCLEVVLRARILLEVQRLLQKRGLTCWICQQDTPIDKLDLVSEFDQRFDSDFINVFLPVNDRVGVALGGEKGGRLWTGYMKSGPGTQTELVRSEAREQLGDIHDEDNWWYAWRYKECDFGHLEGVAKKFANELEGMRQGLLSRLGAITAGNKRKQPRTGL